VIDPWGVLLGEWVFDAALMTVFWLWAVRLHNAGFVDIGWCLGIGLDALAVLLWSGSRSVLAWILAVALWLWAIRLVLYLGGRVIGKPEDPRFGALRNEWRAKGRSENAMLFVVFQTQGLLAVVFSIPVFLASLGPDNRLGALSTGGVFLFAVGFLGEILADRQLARFRAQGAHGVCRKGLWAYSRHPNYFFEFLLWFGLALATLGTSYGAVALVCPALILFFLLRVTGIPATEAHAVESRGEEYRRYQEEVSAFVPWFPRKGRGASG
jgi:steroid 5-alpha reductase family enzyme